MRTVMMPWVALVLCLSSWPVAVSAQGIVGLSPEAPAPYSMREFGVNLSTSDVSISNEDISIGSGDFPTRLALVRTYSAIGYPIKNLPSIARQNQYTGFGQGSTHNLLVYFTRDECTGLGNGRFIAINAVIFGKSYNFSGGGCLRNGSLTIGHNNGEGATLRIINPNQAISTYEVITREGIRAVFTDAALNRYDTTGGRFASFVEFPNGDFLNFTYALSPTVTGSARLESIVNSRGYGLRFNYIRRDRYFGINTMTDSSLINSIYSFKRTGLGDIDVSSVFYTYDKTEYFVASYSNALRQTYRYVYDWGRPAGIFYPKNLTDNPSISISYFDGLSQVGPGFVSVTGPGAVYYLAPLVDNVRDVAWSVPSAITDAAGNKTTFEFSDPTSPDPISVTVTPPAGGKRWYSTVFCSASPACPLPPWYSKNPSAYLDANGNVWRYAYDYHGRPVSTQAPNGLLVTQDRDALGRITTRRVKAAPGTTGADLVWSFGYDPCDAGTFRYCNNPRYTIDPRGGRTDFQYDPASGGLAVSLAPPDANGLRAVTRYTYTRFGYGAVPAPAQLNAAGIYLLTAKDSCLTSTVTSGSADFSYVCGAGSRRRDVFNYTASAAGASSSLELASQALDADRISATTKYAYDNAGNIVSQTDPDGNTSHTTYDLLRRKVVEVSADPDGAGPLRRLVARHVYDDNGNEIRTENGYGAYVDGSDFVLVSMVRRTFDANDKLIRTEAVQP